MVEFQPLCPAAGGDVVFFPVPLELALCGLPLGVVYKAHGWLRNPEPRESLDEGNGEGCPQGPKARGLAVGGNWQSWESSLH